LSHFRRDGRVFQQTPKRLTTLITAAVLAAPDAFARVIHTGLGDIEVQLKTSPVLIGRAGFPMKHEGRCLQIKSHDESAGAMGLNRQWDAR
jgi:hypothetical protein